MLSLLNRVNDMSAANWLPQTHMKNYNFVHMWWYVMFVLSGGDLCKALLFIQWSILSANRDDHKIEFYDNDDDDIIIALIL